MLQNNTIKFSTLIDKVDVTDSIYHGKRKDLLKEKLLRDVHESRSATEKFLEQNPDININCVIEHLQNLTLSTTNCARKLGISPRAFTRLAKKYKLEPVYIMEKSKNRNQFLPKVSPYAVKYFYTSQQISRIPQSEIDLVQIRAARSLKFPDGENVPVKWIPRGHETNGKLKARTKNLSKAGVQVIYEPKKEKYMVFMKTEVLFMSKLEVDKLDCKYGKMKAFT